MARMSLGRLCPLGALTAIASATMAHCAQERIPLAEVRQVQAQGQTEFRFDLAEIPTGKQVRLRLDARIEWPGLGGSTGAMTLAVNGEGLIGRHLINKHLVFAMRNDEELAWASPDGAGYRLLYSPDFSDRVQTDEAYEYGIPDTDPYHFVWDITSYVQPGSNLVTASALKGMSFSLCLRALAVEIGDPLPALVTTATAGLSATEPVPAGSLPEYVPKPPPEMPLAIGVSTRGRLRFRVGQRDFSIRSRTSLPEGRWSEGGKTPEAWSELHRGVTSSSQWTEAQYSVARQVTLHTDRIAVADTIRNTSAALLGVVLEVRLDLPEEPARSVLAGHLVKRLKQRSSPAHPTALAEFSDLAVGLVAEDDIFRIHAKAFVEERVLALADPHLGIAPGQAHTLEWCLYAIPQGDYWDFVNAIRRNWGSNATLRGPSVWVHPAGVPGRAETAKQWLQGASMVVLCNPMFGSEEERLQGITIQHGTALTLCQAWCEQAANAVRVLKEADPGGEAFVYTHQNLCTEPGHEGKYQDSRALDTAGRPATTVYSPSPSLFVPTLSNSYGKALMAVQRHIAETLDAHIYIDEITASNVPAFGAYGDTWDGCTVAIDPVSHAVTGKLSSTILLMQPWRETLVGYLKTKGKAVIANGPHYTRTMMGWGLQCFVESAAEDNAAIGAHLSHPLCLSHYSGPFSTARYNAARRLLDRAGILFAAFSAEAPVFPITPVELRAGVIIGEERILTNRSGRFGWGDSSAADVHVFDGEGSRVQSPDSKTVRHGGSLVTELRLPDGHLAILVRRKG